MNLLCVLCGVQVFPSPDGVLPACTGTADGYHVNTAEARYMTPADIQRRIERQPEAPSDDPPPPPKPIDGQLELE